MKHMKLFAALIMAASLLIFPLSAAAAEAAPCMNEPPTIVESVAEESAHAETTPDTVAETAPETITETETDEDRAAAIVGGLYETGRQWAVAHPELFAAIVIAGIALLAILIQFIGNIRIKKKVVTSSDNAVEICHTTTQQIQANNERANEHIALLLQRADEMVKEVIRQKEEADRNREAVVLLSEVVSRLMEESALPARTRNDIHKLVARAERLIDRKEKDHEQTEGQSEA